MSYATFLKALRKTPRKWRVSDDGRLRCGSGLKLRCPLSWFADRPPLPPIEGPSEESRDQKPHLQPHHRRCRRPSGPLPAHPPRPAQSLRTEGESMTSHFLSADQAPPLSLPSRWRTWARRLHGCLWRCKQAWLQRNPLTLGTRVAPPVEPPLPRSTTLSRRVLALHVAGATGCGIDWGRLR